MNDARWAALKAIEHLMEIYKDQKIENLLIEEIENDDDPGNQDGWLITLGFDLPNADSNPLGNVFSPNSNRIYKILRLRKSGELISMKIRETQAL